MISEGASASIANVRSCGCPSHDLAMPALQRSPANTGAPCVSFLRVLALAPPLPPWRDTGRIGCSTTDPAHGSTRWLHDVPLRLCARVRQRCEGLMVGYSRRSPAPSDRRGPGFREAGIVPSRKVNWTALSEAMGQRVASRPASVKPKKKAEAVNLGFSQRVGIALRRPLRRTPRYPYP